MTIETKFNIHQDVFFLKNNKVESSQITAININAHTCGDAPNRIEIKYTLQCTATTIETDNEIFHSKEELLESL